MAAGMIKIDNVSEGGDAGHFRANSEQLGWIAADGSRKVVHATTTVKRGEWRDGCLRLQCQSEEGEMVLFGLDGIDNARFDDLWRFFEAQCGVYIKKHNLKVDISADDFDSAMRAVSAAADKVDEAAVGSVSKRAGEADLMKKVEGLRDGLDLAVSGDKQALSRVFAENGCERIGRLRLVLATVNLEVYKKDPRWLNVRGLAKTVENILKELGRFKVWKPGEEEADSSMQRRQMVRELRQRSGDDVEEEDEVEPEPAAPKKLNMAAFQAPVLAGLMPSSSAADNPLAYSAPKAVVQEPPAPVREPEPPAQPAPVVEEEPAASEGAPDEDWDIEVDNPNEVQAAAPDAKGKKGSADGGRIRYIFSNSILEGWVWKRSQYLKKWRRRWLVLQPDHLATYKQRSVGGQTEKVEKGTVQMVYNADAEVMQTKAFCVTAAVKRTLGVRVTKLFMVCDTDKLRDAWLTAIQDTLGGRK